MQKLLWRLKLEVDFGDGSMTEIEVGRIEGRPGLTSRRSFCRVAEGKWLTVAIQTGPIASGNH
jgi:hypothetical protein